MISALLLALAAPSVSQTGANFQVYNFPEIDSCAEWTASRSTKEQHKQSMVKAHALEGWVLGFISAYNLYGAKDNGLSIDPKAQGLLSWIDNYCAVNPLDSVTAATVRLIDELEKRKNSKAK